MQKLMVGSGTVQLPMPAKMRAGSSIVGQKEKKGPFGSDFDMVSTDENDMFGAATWEEAESELQRKAVETVLHKTGLQSRDIRFIFAGDLLGQEIASSFGLQSFSVPLFGLYGACSTCGEALSLGSMMIAAGYAERVVCVTSSHFASAEKEFRFPLSYGGQRPLSASWTVTGSGAFVLEQAEPAVEESGTTARKKESYAAITAITPGKIVDYGIKDSFNMGCAMAPAAADTILRHLKDLSRSPESYDRIITGDLGVIGSKALIDLLKEHQIDITNQHMDCGAEIYGHDTVKDLAGLDTHAGGSGCGCSAVMLAAVYLPKLISGEWSRILFVPTGALLNKVSFNEGNTVPGIAHAVVIEHIAG